jgi:hypothetical protein
LLITACLKNINMPNFGSVFRHPALFSLGIHKVFLRENALTDEKCPRNWSHRCFSNGAYSFPESEPLQIGSGGDFALLDFSQSREKASSENFSRAARVAQTAKQFASSRRRRRSAGEARRQTRVLHRDCEKLSGFGNGTVANRQQCGFCTA